MSRLRHVIVSVLLSAICAVAITPDVAVAQTRVVHDKSHDVVHGWWTDCAPSGAGCVEHSGPDRSNKLADIVWSRHSFTRHRLTLQLKLRKVSNRRHIPTYVGWDVQGPHHRGLLSTQLMYDQGAKDVFVGGYSDNFHCRGSRGTVHRRSGVFTLSIPTRCVGNTKWVRVATSVLVEDFGSDAGNSWYDDPLADNDLQIDSSVAERHFGPKLFHG
jgi:hypothetical protein